jgi:hypothetical protein
MDSDRPLRPISLIRNLLVAETAVAEAESAVAGTCIAAPEKTPDRLAPASQRHEHHMISDLKFSLKRSPRRRSRPTDQI